MHHSIILIEQGWERRKYAKLSIGADVLQHIICTIKIRRAPTRHDSIDFRPTITRIAEILPLFVVTADKEYDLFFRLLQVFLMLGSFLLCEGISVLD